MGRGGQLRRLHSKSLSIQLVPRSHPVRDLVLPQTRRVQSSSFRLGVLRHGSKGAASKTGRQVHFLLLLFLLEEVYLFLQIDLLI